MKLSLDNPEVSKTRKDEILEKRDLTNPANITPAVIDFLARKFTPEIIAGKIGELLEANHVTKGGQLIPDNRAREGGLKLLLAYLLGLPVQRQEIVQVNLDSLEALQAKVHSSPALRASVEKLLEVNTIRDSVKSNEVSTETEPQ